MAKAKAKAVQRSKVRKSSELPEGYKTLDRAPAWDVDQHSILEGVRGPTETQEFRDGSTQRMCPVDDKTLGVVTVKETTMLKGLFDNTDAGDTVRIEFLGYKPPAVPGDSPTKLFSCAVKEGKKSPRGRAPF